MWEPTLPRAAATYSRNPAEDLRRPNPPLSTTGRASFKASVSSASGSLWPNRSPSARLGKHPTAERMVSTLNRYELAGCGSSAFDTTDSRPRASTPVVRQKTGCPRTSLGQEHVGSRDRSACDARRFDPFTAHQKSEEASERLRSAKPRSTPCQHHDFGNLVCAHSSGRA